MTHIDLAVVDVDGAIRESEAAVAGDTRAQMFRKAAIGGGAVLGSGAIMGMLPEMAAARPSKKQDLRILNYALTLEYLEAAFYKEAVDSGAISGAALEFAKLVFDHEATHVTVLRKTIRSLGGKPVKSPEFDFKGTNREQGKFLQTAFVLENTGVRAYLGQAPRLQSRALLAAAAAIATVEARHSAAVAVLIGESPFAGKKSITPSGAFDRASSMKTILREVGATGFITG
ncbi:MAG TPA: ferritin-like domain-containing protein [Solirubrobacteraceae bacterium]|nr:ferritin-like domain-containing protein [Solirubrobacteraceae bacterium]